MIDNDIDHINNDTTTPTSSSPPPLTATTMITLPATPPQATTDLTLEIFFQIVFQVMLSQRKAANNNQINIKHCSCVPSAVLNLRQISSSGWHFYQVGPGFP